ncbi:hypothetical protein POM88_020735 [Heracleum sosnowskyi]|uniref:Uncharacterized protein n=1 Tax=Heracleum sosnowskyi TaxID=360622 RepID=A0AAD8ICE8_9APIA|nr:hypothetical protein POM88_020735 [Heracleum sosnowskyi]
MQQNNFRPVDDQEKLLVSADFARKASYRACSNSFWKKMECHLTSITSQDESYLNHQPAVIDAPCLYQILICAIIETDEIKERSLYGDGKNDFPCSSDDSHSVDQISENDKGSVEDMIRV